MESGVREKTRQGCCWLSCWCTSLPLHSAWWNSHSNWGRFKFNLSPLKISGAWFHSSLQPGRLGSLVSPPEDRVSGEWVALLRLSNVVKCWFPKLLGICPRQKQTKNFRKKCNQQQLPSKREKLSGVNFFSGPSTEWVRWVKSDFDKIPTRFLGFSPSHVPSSATLVSPSSPLRLPSHSSLARFSPALLLLG